MSRSKIISTDHCTIFRLFQSKMIIRCETLRSKKKKGSNQVCQLLFTKMNHRKREREREKKVSFHSAFYFRQQDQNPRGKTKTSDFNVRCRCFVHFRKLMLRLLLKCHKFDKQLLSNCVSYLSDTLLSLTSPNSCLWFLITVILSPVSPLVLD